MFSIVNFYIQAYMTRHLANMHFSFIAILRGKGSFIKNSNQILIYWTFRNVSDALSLLSKLGN
ncbi:hypothetical protein BHE74_00009581 [Ensete ventricosum]|uniref:Uncharacterized protein n=1 Tax=Ensete ventricosum TaxID=4639 RepID=A0A427AU44_ENSVE|nr:hypothetical protein B296_00009762 [Ensete ventricosum]RWW15187.1 hypothetical protein GW17_00020987 [Ensete ventricosum]RWW81983.1 hypothetical protein BHE74_00009581 [Ensete ventricosum]RZR85109.1 hypothetical protein BHM03_00012070 [Ensete ventricosum]